MLYYRSDSRSPVEIYEKGFTTFQDFGEKWWEEGIRKSISNQRGLKNGQMSPVDAEPNAAICLTTKFETAGLFPLFESNNETHNRTTYIYAIALPDATKIIYKPNPNGGDQIPYLERTENTPTDINKIIIDLHSLQVTQAGNIANDIVSKYGNWMSGDRQLVGALLYGYEALAYQIQLENIICAVKCNQKQAEAIKIRNLFFSKIVYQRKFTIDDDILLNPRFNQKSEFSLWINENPCINNLDFSKDQLTALQTFKANQEKDLQTPNPHYGLGGKCF